MQRPIPQNARVPGKPRIRVQPTAPRGTAMTGPAQRPPRPRPTAGRVIFSDWAAI